MSSEDTLWLVIVLCILCSAVNVVAALYARSQRVKAQKHEAKTREYYKQIEKSVDRVAGMLKRGEL
ncbi:hypothetical protein GCM10010423_64910 [Streptomyces levis]|uniref:Uncharacterized protein n=1 Tax=Streptomyces levis TaxID=285566 RepID=A0ABP6BBY4_9ACTN